MVTTRLIKIILITIGVIGLAIFAYMYFQGEHKKESRNDIKEEYEKIEQSKYPGVDIITKTSDEKTYHKAIHYPKFKEQPLNDEIKNYVLKVEQNFHEELDKHDAVYLQEHPAQYYLTFKIYPVMDELYSIVFYEDGYFGGANSRLSNKVFLVDLNSNQFIKQSEILQVTKESREKIYKLLYNAFKQSEQYSAFLNEDYLKEWVEQENNKFSNMFLTNQSVVFKFDKYEVTAGAAGMPEIELPFDQVRDILSEKWVERLNVKGDMSNDESSEANNDVSEVKPREESEKNLAANGKRVALTFDDGPHPKNTMKILDLLKKYDAKATFFMLGSRVDFYPLIAKRVAEEGHELGNHTWNHKDLTTLSSESIEQEVNDTSEVILQVTGQKPTVIRPPYGATNKQVEAVLNLPSILWTVDTMDWKTHNPQAVLEEVRDNVQDGSIILMHDIHESTVAAVELVLKYLEENGYTCVTVSDIL